MWGDEEKCKNDQDIFFQEYDGKFTNHLFVHSIIWKHFLGNL